MAKFPSVQTKANILELSNLRPCVFKDASNGLRSRPPTLLKFEGHSFLNRWRWQKPWFTICLTCLLPESKEFCELLKIVLTVYATITYCWRSTLKKNFVHLQSIEKVTKRQISLIWSYCLGTKIKLFFRALFDSCQDVGWGFSFIHSQDLERFFWH